MSNAAKSLLLAVLTVVIVGGVYALTRANHSAKGNLLIGIPGVVTQAANVPFGFPTTAPDMSLDIQAWSQFCVDETAYTLLSLPIDASFRIGTWTASDLQANVVGQVQPTTQPIPANAKGNLPSQHTSQGSLPANKSDYQPCIDAGTMDGRKIVICRGRGPARFNLSSGNTTGVDVFTVTLPDCTYGDPLRASSVSSGVNDGTSGAGEPSVDRPPGHSDNHRRRHPRPH